MGQVDYGKDVLKIFQLASRMSRRIAELENEVSQLQGYLDLKDKAILPSTEKILVSAAKAATAIVTAGPVAAGSKVEIVSRKKTGSLMPKKDKASSEYFGVSLIKKTGKWLGQIERNRLKFKQMFDDELTAAIAVQKKLGNYDEAVRIQGILAAKCKDVPQVKAVVKSAADSETRQKKKEALSQVDGRHERQAADGLGKLSDECSWMWECPGCGETSTYCPDHNCPKCGGRGFKKIQVLDNPRAMLERAKGRHNK